MSGAAAPRRAHGPSERDRLRERIVDVLWDLQERHGFLDDAAVREAGERCGLTPSEVDEVATFYNLLHRRPAGRTRVYVCDGISCELNGAAKLMAALQHAFGIAPGEVTSDGRFGLLPTVCLGHCDRAPCLMAGNRILGPCPVDREGVSNLAGEIRTHGPGSPASGEG